MRAVMMNRNELPIFEIEQTLAGAVGKVGRVIVQAPTGSGKSTQIPQMLLDHGLLGDGQVVILQPRRLATRMLAARVARERNVRLGDEVGYQIRFEDHSGPRTRIKYETEGILLRQMLTNPKLDGVSAIIFDEFHERHLYGDITLARALQIQESARPDLKLLVMSATLDLGPLEKYLSPCAVLTSEGRTFPVAVEYLEGRVSERPPGDYEEPVWELAAREFERAVHEGAEGDFLIFMPGAYEISRTVQAIKNSPLARGFIVLPLHGELAADDQDAAVARYDQRKVVVSTNVAESSLTIDGVRVVIDSGLARIPKFDPYRGINTLLIERISRASADQRAGPRRPHRAGAMRAALDRTRTRRTSAAGSAGGEAARSRGGRADAQGERRRGCETFPLAGAAGPAIAGPRGAAAARSRRAGLAHGLDHGARPPDAFVPGPSALLADADRGERLRLRPRRRADRRADAGAQPADAAAGR